MSPLLWIEPYEELRDADGFIEEPEPRDFKLEFAQWDYLSQQYLAGKGKR